jgi:hypothetical protein
MVLLTLHAIGQNAISDAPVNAWFNAEERRDLVESRMIDDLDALCPYYAMSDEFDDL